MIYLKIYKHNLIVVTRKHLWTFTKTAVWNYLVETIIFFLLKNVVQSSLGMLGMKGGMHQVTRAVPPALPRHSPVFVISEKIPHQPNLKSVARQSASYHQITADCLWLQCDVLHGNTALCCSWFPLWTHRGWDDSTQQHSTQVWSRAIKVRERKYGGAEHVELSAAIVLTASRNPTWPVSGGSKHITSRREQRWSVSCYL